MIFDLPKPDAKDLTDFLAFYDRFAPRLWTQVLAANLPPPEARKIMVQTFMHAWRHPHQQSGEDQVQTWLLDIACKEGLPADPTESVRSPS